MLQIYILIFFFFFLFGKITSNFRIVLQAHTGEGKYVFVRLHKPFQGDTVSLHSIKDGKAETDVLVYF